MTDEQKQQMLDRLKLGVSYQMLLLFVEQSFVWEKEDSLTTLTTAFEQFVNSLTEEQQKEFSEKMMGVLEQKADQVEKEAAEQLSPGDLASVKAELVKLATAEETKSTQ